MHKTCIVLLLSILLSAGCNNDDEVMVEPMDDPIEDPVQGPPVADAPNILLIIADDLGIDATPGYDFGGVEPHMPNLQKMASEGITFDNVWAYPICSPTRASILTGRYGYRTGVLDVTTTANISTSEKTLQSFLDDNTNSAYSHSIIGKWHLSNNEPERPTEMGVGYYAGLLGGGVSDYNNWPLTENGETNSYAGYITTKLTDLAIDWIGAQSKPWFCWLAYTAPHTPFHLPAEEMHSQGNLPTDQASIDANPLPYYMAMNESLDFEIGRLLESMPAVELENTVIIFIGDNGTPGQVTQAPYEMTRSKGSLYQGGIHVPMVISGKGVTRANVRDENLIHSVDLFSSIAEIAGVDLPVYEDSQSFAPLLDAEVSGIRNYNYTEVLGTNANKTGFTIRNHTHKYLEFESGQKRFYDLSNDPYEMQNLLMGTMTADEISILSELEQAALDIRQ